VDTALQYLLTVLIRIRRSAGLLLALFAGHLTLVAAGAVCVVPGMQAMAGQVSPDASGSMVSMPGMGGIRARNTTVAPTPHLITDAGTAADQHARTGSASATCSAAMSCITSLGADDGESIALSPLLHGAMETMDILMPASSVFAPDIPPPRA
jgi:hypothetical protein